LDDVSLGNNFLGAFGRRAYTISGAYTIFVDELLNLGIALARRGFFLFAATAAANHRSCNFSPYQPCGRACSDASI
jgi:hypothetical protein